MHTAKCRYCFDNVGIIYIIYIHIKFWHSKDGNDDLNADNKLRNKYTTVYSRKSSFFFSYKLIDIGTYQLLVLV